MIFIAWLVIGVSSQPLIFIIISITISGMYSKRLEKEIFLGFFYVLTLSDSRLESMAWAANVKVLYVVILGLILIKDFKDLQYTTNIFKYLIPFNIIALSCVFFSPVPFASFQKILSYFLLFLVVPNYLLKIYSLNKNELLRDIAWLTCLLLITGFLLNFVNSDIAYSKGRYRGVLGNPNGLGIFTMLFLIFLSFLNEFEPMMFSKREKLFLFSIGIISLLLSGSRSSLIGIFIFFVLKRFYKISPFLGFVVMICVLFIFQFISDNIELIIHSLGAEKFFRVETLKDGSGRLVAWNFAWDNIQKNFFIGKGFGYTDYLFRENYHYLSKLGHEGHAHNAYLTFWLDTGLVGLVIFFIGFFTMFVNLSKTSPLIFPLLFAVLFSNQFESWLTASLNPFTIQLLFILAIVVIIGIERKKGVRTEIN